MTFALQRKSGDGEFVDYKVRAALRPTTSSFRRDCACGDAVLLWEDIELEQEQAVWTLTTEQSKNLAVGKYAMEIALHNIYNGEEIKESTTNVIEVKQSYTR